jgi:hypothetical protein
VGIRSFPSNVVPAVSILFNRTEQADVRRPPDDHHIPKTSFFDFLAIFLRLPYPSLDRCSGHSAPDSVETLVGQVADEFTQRLNRGEQPEIEEYAQCYPHIAPLLRQMLPALQLIRVPAGGPVFANESSAAQPEATGCLGDFRIVHEIGRGGMGVVSSG